MEPIVASRNTRPVRMLTSDQLADRGARVSGGRVGNAETLAVVLPARLSCVCSGCRYCTPCCCTL
jgi:hypothetical protein